MDTSLKAAIQRHLEEAERAAVRAVDSLTRAYSFSGTLPETTRKSIDRLAGEAATLLEEIPFAWRAVEAAARIRTGE